MSRKKTIRPKIKMILTNKKAAREPGDLSITVSEAEVV